MQILSVHSRYQIRGGEEEVFESESGLLREMGHRVEVYEESNDRVADSAPWRMALRTIWSERAHQITSCRLTEHPYDVVHVHNFFPPISPSIYYAAKTKGVPVVQTLHNYRLLCPNALLFREERICEDCCGKSIPWPGILHGCYRGSRAATGATALMLAVHRAMSTWTEMVDCYIALTEFARQKFIKGGLPADKIVVKPNFVHPDPGIGRGNGGYALYVGRLSVEKGIDTLLAAWERLDGRIPLRIIGDGPLAGQVIEATKRLSQVKWLGRRPMSEVYHLMGEAAMLIFPSKWYETFGRVAVEAFAKGTPVVAAGLGAIAELVERDRTGLHFCPGDPQDLAAKVDWLLERPKELARMRREARLEYETKYTAEKNYQQLIEIYERVRYPCAQLSIADSMS